MLDLAHMQKQKQHKLSSCSWTMASDSPLSQLIRQDSEAEAELKLALEEASLEAGVTLPYFSPTALFLQVVEDAIPVGKLAKWLKSTRKFRSKASSLSEAQRAMQEHDINSHDIIKKLHKEDGSSGPDNISIVENRSLQEFSAHERLQKAAIVDINASNFSWQKLVSLHSIEHVTNSVVEDDETLGSFEVTVNSGGLVFFALFENGLDEKGQAQETAACLKFTSSRLSTQSERLGYELAKYLRVSTPQARVIHYGTAEWGRMKEAVEKARTMAITCKIELEEKTCNEMLEALNLSCCVLLMGYIHGHPFLESSMAFATQSAAESIATSLGRLIVLDLVLRNEDRLVCRELGWRGNPRNLLCTTEKPAEHVLWKRLKESKLYSWRKLSPKGPKKNLINLEKRSQSAINFSPPLADELGINRTGSDDETHTTLRTVSPPTVDFESQQHQKMKKRDTVFLVAIDSGVPRRPPAGKRTNDTLIYPKFVELLLNDSNRASELLWEISGGNLGSMKNGLGISTNQSQVIKHHGIVHSFQTGFRSGLKDMQQLQLFLLSLYRKLDRLLKQFIVDVGDSVVTMQEQSPLKTRPSKAFSRISSPQGSTTEQNSEGKHAGEQPELQRGPACKNPENIIANDSNDSSKVHSNEKKKSPSSNSQITRRLTLKLKDVNKTAKIDTDLRKYLQQWDAILRKECEEICETEGFVTGFLESDGSHSLVDSYELKVRLEHVLERMALISQGSDTEKPSCVLESLYIGGALAAKSVHTLQHLGITHVLCLCPSDFGLLEEHKGMFQHQHFEIQDTDDEHISAYFEDACSFIANAERLDGKVLVHCFEGISRSATIVLAYLMMHKGQTLFEAWTNLKARHQRSKPNDGFMMSLTELDRALHGKASMEWQQKRPFLRICPVCGKTAGISNESLQHHLRKKHAASDETVLKLPKA
ncbi:hypothetical protein O6H91_08G003800 [Diphasiastrum complanatum]|uniref:Uncharacterized protein n=1 Tax=Diphasiastrum complanatum TaxID=34168 RepID=A0ACC2CUD6_DIPCM|nr:hypothetical protein O6H91_08G003800 [Diphasiastrum complanatum]